MLALGLQSIYLYFLYMRGFIYNFLLCKVYLTSDLKLTDLLKPEMPSPYFLLMNTIVNYMNISFLDYHFLKCILQFMMHRYTLFSVILYCIAFDIPSRKSWSLYSKCVQYRLEKNWYMKETCYLMVEKKI